MISDLPSELLEQAYVSFTCRRVKLEDAHRLIKEPYQPAPGDIVLAKIDSVGQHKRIELANGRKASLCVDDLVLLAYGNRYAPDQFEGLVPHNLSRCDMVAAGGIAAREVERNFNMENPTQVQPLGVLANAEGHALNLCYYRMSSPQQADSKPPVFLVCGTSMNAGKTHTAASLIRGLAKSGYRVGATKVTGTGSGGDMWRMKDAGACVTLDFTDAGYASTYMQTPQQIIRTTESLINSLASGGADVIVMEVADGLGHSETRELLQDGNLKRLVNGVLFAAGDAMSAAAGTKWLRQWGLPLIAISGRVTLSPLAVRELAALEAVEVFNSDALSSPSDLKYLLADSFIHHAIHKETSLPTKGEEHHQDKPLPLINSALPIQRGVTNSVTRGSKIKSV